ncbi:hypothetical protein [Rhodopirellula bahusiensis]|uniref:hypothetical protein n=1 Tax=Rhodopirellula bahusiensis TaxID=2014065 RepID=UPI00326753DB
MLDRKRPNCSKRPSRQRMRSLALVLASIVIAHAGSVLADDGNALFDQMLKDGIPLTDDSVAPLPAPTFLDPSGEPVVAKEVESQLQKLSRAGGIQRFVRDSAVAPIAIDMDSISNSDDQRIGHLLDVTFVVHASIDLVQDSDALNSLLGVRKTDDQPDDVGAANQVSEEELTKLGISLDGETESFGRVSFPLLDRVMVEGVIHAETHRHLEGDSGDFVTVAWHLDPRFENSWSPIERNDLGKEVTGDSKPYQGLGGVITATRLPAEITGEDADATIVQARLVVHEPVDWFGGRNQLRSKLPLIIQDRVRDLRRKLAEVHDASR